MDRRIFISALGGLMLADIVSGANASEKKGSKPVIVEAGRRVDAPDTTTARFPAANVSKVRDKIRQLLDAQRPSAVVSSAACGTDLLFLPTVYECWTDVVV